MAEIAETIAEDIQLALDQDNLELPALPEVALRIREVAESEFVSAISLGKVVAEDPGLSAQLVRIANSPMFRATRSIDDLTMAISRLGVDYAANLVTGLAMQHMFQATSELIDRRMRQVWKSSTTVAAWSSILCNRFTKLGADQAMLAGPTHCIGILPILSWAEENDDVVRDSITLDNVIDAIHPSIGTMILKHWNFSDDVTKVPENYQDLGYETATADYVDIVCAANLFSLMDTEESIADQDWADCGALGRIGVSPHIDPLVFLAMREEVANVASVFG